MYDPSKLHCVAVHSELAKLQRASSGEDGQPYSTISYSLHIQRKREERKSVSYQIAPQHLLGLSVKLLVFLDASRLVPPAHWMVCTPFSPPAHSPLYVRRTGVFFLA